jgi:hypothetical protein
VDLERRYGLWVRQMISACNGFDSKPEEKSNIDRTIEDISRSRAKIGFPFENIGVEFTHRYCEECGDCVTCDVCRCGP